MRTIAYDEHQFAGLYRQKQPVHAEYTAEGTWSSPGLDYNDYSRMHKESHKGRGDRRLDAPMWAFNAAALRELIVCFCEARAGIRAAWKKAPPAGTLQERLARACAQLQARVPAHIETLKALCARYVTAKHQPEPDRARLRELEITIEGLDSQIRIADRVPQVVAAIVRYYYGLNMDSVAIAAELGLKPPAVRMIIWRLRRTWEQMQQQRPVVLSPVRDALRSASIALKTNPATSSNPIKSQAAKKRWSDPDARARQSAAMRTAYARPEVRARHSAGLRAAWARRKQRSK